MLVNLRIVMIKFIIIGCVILINVHLTEQTPQFLSEERTEYINEIAKIWMI